MSNAVPWNEPTGTDEPIASQAPAVDTDYFSIAYSATDNLLTVGFGSKQAAKETLVKIAKTQIDRLADEIVAAQTGKPLKINGAMTTMITAVVTAALYNRVRAIALYDPDQSVYVIVTNKDGFYPIGGLWLPDDIETSHA